MVARINVSPGLTDVLRYHERKVEKGMASCIYAGNFLADANELSRQQKLAGLQTRNCLNQRAINNTLHVSLNLHPSDKLTEPQFVRLALQYVEKIGFQQQPFLVYRHWDAGHPHAHVVASMISKVGAVIKLPIPLFHRSRLAQDEINREFRLRGPGFSPVYSRSYLKNARASVQPLQYGKQELIHGINAVVESVLNQGHFSCLDDFNQALRAFNVLAYRGKEGSFIYQHEGLLYFALDNQGKKIGFPVKASLLPSRPILSVLKRRFETDKVWLAQKRENEGQVLPLSNSSYQEDSVIAWQKNRLSMAATVDATRQKLKWGI